MTQTEPTANLDATQPDALEVLRRSVDALGGDHRPGQQRLALAVAAALDDRHHLLAEAPTGSGKSLAYLAPIVASGRRVVIATATLALQDQLWRKDIPHVRAHSGVAFSAALLKGRGQYVCLAKLERARADDALFDERPGAGVEGAIELAAKFAADSRTGDLADLDVPDVVRRAVSCGAHECPSAAKCHVGDRCCAEDAREQAADVDVLVVNHALYCAHLASGGHVLPEHDAVVFDEAHGLADVATDALGIDVAPIGLRQLAARLAGVGVPKADTDALADAADGLATALDALDGRVDPTEDPLGGALVRAAERLVTASRGIDRESDATAIAQVTQLAASRIEALRRVRSPEEGEVVWVEGARPVLRLAPVSVGEPLAAQLFGLTPSILVSATLGVGPRFVASARALGLEPRTPFGPTPALGYEALEVESPFDHRTQAMLYVPTHLPDRRDAAWGDAAADELCALVDAAGGRALVLCTSRREVERFAAVLRDRTDHPVLAQNDGPKARLVEQFAADARTCLVATRSFWVGIDVPGAACVLVVIDRLPFPRPDEPLGQARRERAEASGGNGFIDVDVPRAALVLAQGTGRLIRTPTDRGVVAAVLDRRLATARYRTELLAGLPPMRRVIDREIVLKFLTEAGANDEAAGQR